jgi:hypothetical protein
MITIAMARIVLEIVRDHLPHSTLENDVIAKVFLVAIVLYAEICPLKHTVIKNNTFMSIYI